MTRKALAGCCLLVLTAGCAEVGGGWENASLPQEAWSRDESDCRSQAADKSRQYQTRLGDKWSEPHNPALGVTNAWEWQNAERLKREFVDNCMTQKGYVWTTAPDASSRAADDTQAQ